MLGEKSDNQHQKIKTDFFFNYLPYSALTMARNLWFLFPLALKSSLKSYQMFCFVQNDKVFTQMMMISLKLLF